MKKTYRTDLTCFLGDEEKESVEGTLMGVMMEAGCRAQELPFRHAAFSIKEGGLKRAMDAVRCLGIRGAYLAPVHRADVLSCLDELSAAARLTGQVNAVFSLDGRLVGENTGGKGFVTSLMEEGIFLTGKTLTILGTGDAARAAAVEAALSESVGYISQAKMKSRARRLPGCSPNITGRKYRIFPGRRVKQHGYQKILILYCGRKRNRTPRLPGKTSTGFRLKTMAL